MPHHYNYCGLFVQPGTQQLYRFTTFVVPAQIQSLEMISCAIAALIRTQFPTSFSVMAIKLKKRQQKQTNEGNWESQGSGPQMMMTWTVT